MQTYSCNMSQLMRFIAATGFANLADGVALVAWGWLATQLTRDPLLIAMVPVALKAPWFVFSLPAGIIADRFDRKRLILAADTLRALAYACAGLVIWLALPFSDPPDHGTDRPLIFTLIGISAITVGIAEVVRDTTAQTLLPTLIPDDQLERANGRLWSVEFIMNNFVGTAIAGLLLGLSLALPFGVNALALLLAIALISGLHGDFRANTSTVSPAPATTDWRQELREGIAFLLSHLLLRRLAMITGLFNFGFQAMMVTLVLIVQERLQMGPLALSAIMAAGAVGGVFGGVINERIVAKVGKSKTLQYAMIGILFFPLSVLLVSDNGYAGLAVICMAFGISEFWGVLWNTVAVSYRQRHTPRRLLGRVNSAYRLFAIGMAPLGMLSAGILTHIASNFLDRPLALLMPFLLSLAIFLVVLFASWRFAGRAFPVEPAATSR